MPGFYAIVLAAGQSSRMGREKASLPWLDGKSLLTWTVETLEAGGWQVKAVVGPDRLSNWVAELGARVIANPNPLRGKNTSLATGAGQVPPDASRILITAVDQPRPASLYRSLRETAETNPAKILVPDFAGRRGHPVVLPGSLRDQLLSVGESTFGLRGLLDSHREETCRLPLCDPAWLHWDLNTMSDYETALAFFQEHA